MEIYPSVHQIDVPSSAGRIVTLYLLLGERPILVDSGWIDSPLVGVKPYMESIGRSMTSLWAVVNTHAHADHCAGNQQLKQLAPAVRIMASELERADVEDTAAAARAFFDPYRKILGDAATDGGIAWTSANNPASVVDVALKDGESLRPSKDWPIEVHLAPGHTKGHLVLYDRGHKTAFIGDAVGWKGVVAGDKITNFPPYEDVDGYLRTIQMVRSWKLQYLCTSHYSTRRGKDITTFLDESEAFVTNLDMLVKEQVKRGANDLNEITKAVVGVIGGDYLCDICALFTVDAHLKRLRGSN
jgi:glyoxylase-like metal-dependent hydrolase (beta-lactamase superfamily II)